MNFWPPLPPPPKCWGCKHSPPSPVYSGRGSNQGCYGNQVPFYQQSSNQAVEGLILALGEFDFDNCLGITLCLVTCVPDKQTNLGNEAPCHFRKESLHLPRLHYLRQAERAGRGSNWSTCGCDQWKGICPFVDIPLALIHGTNG